MAGLERLSIAFDLSITVYADLKAALSKVFSG